jgi:hypothetical protein
MATESPIADEPNPVHWIHVPYTEAKMTDLDVGRDGIVWGCDANGVPVVREGITQTEHNGNKWSAQGENQINNCARVAVCTSGHVWVVTEDHQVYFRNGIYKSDIIGQGWTQMNPTNM